MFSWWTFYGTDINFKNDINQPITREEIFKGINMLKNTKACGNDRFFNECIKSTQDCMLQLNSVLFNNTFDFGVIPTQWVSDNIILVYKNKGDSTKPQNHTPITLLSCLGKLFTAVINERLNKYMLILFNSF